MCRARTGTMTSSIGMRTGSTTTGTRMIVLSSSSIFRISASQCICGAVFFRRLVFPSVQHFANLLCFYRNVHELFLAYPVKFIERIEHELECIIFCDCTIYTAPSFFSCRKICTRYGLDGFCEQTVNATAERVADYFGDVPHCFLPAYIRGKRLDRDTG